MSGANTLAYLASSAAIKKTSFITLTPGGNIADLVFFVNDGGMEKARLFVPSIFSDRFNIHL